MSIFADGSVRSPYFDRFVKDGLLAFRESLKDGRFPLADLDLALNDTFGRANLISKNAWLEDIMQFDPEAFSSFSFSSGTGVLQITFSFPSLEVSGGNYSLSGVTNGSVVVGGS